MCPLKLYSCLSTLSNLDPQTNNRFVSCKTFTVEELFRGLSSSQKPWRTAGLWLFRQQPAVDAVYIFQNSFGCLLRFLGTLSVCLYFHSLSAYVGQPWCRGRTVDIWSENDRFDSCQSVLGPDTEPHIAPGGLRLAPVQGSRATINVWTRQ